MRFWKPFMYSIAYVTNNTSLSTSRKRNMPRRYMTNSYPHLQPIVPTSNIYPDILSPYLTCAQSPILYSMLLSLRQRGDFTGGCVYKKTTQPDDDDTHDDDTHEDDTHEDNSSEESELEANLNEGYMLLRSFRY